MQYFFIFIFIFLFNATVSFGHTLYPGYIEINTVKKNHYAIKLKKILNNNEEINFSPIFPNDCVLMSSKKYDILSMNNIFLSYWTIQCKKSLIGRKISINSTNSSMDVLVRFQDINSKSQIKRTTNEDPHFYIENNNMATSSIIKTYIKLGIKHIAFGFDHLLFILGLMLLINSGKNLIKVITAFTIAHSITLSMSILGYMYINPLFIEILIALSILIVAVELQYISHGDYRLFSKYPWSITFVFGLLHGFGFANILNELDLPDNKITALFFFNLGIEIGQVIFIFILVAIYKIFRRVIKINKLSLCKDVLIYFIGILSSYWLIERVVLLYQIKPFY